MRQKLKYAYCHPENYAMLRIVRQSREYAGILQLLQKQYFTVIDGVRVKTATIVAIGIGCRWPSYPSHSYNMDENGESPY